MRCKEFGRSRTGSAGSTRASSQASPSHDNETEHGPDAFRSRAYASCETLAANVNRGGQMQAKSDRMARNPLQIRYSRSAGLDWRAQRESNPCFRRERATSWTARRWAHRAAARAPPTLSPYTSLAKGQAGFLRARRRPICTKPCRTAGEEVSCAPFASTRPADPKLLRSRRSICRRPGRGRRAFVTRRSGSIISTSISATGSIPPPCRSFPAARARAR